MNEELFTIIVLSYNNLQYMVSCLESILEQDYASIEIIFADDGSREFDKAMIERYISENKKDNLVNNITVLNTMKYDCDMFKYVFDTDTMMNDFKTFVGDYNIFIVEDSYTLDYLSYLDNKMELIYPYLNMEYSLDVFDKIIDKYNLEFSNHLVDLIYEAIIYESNNKN